MKSARCALLASLLVALANGCGARSSLSLAESSAGSGGGGAASASSAGGAGGGNACDSIMCDTPPSACFAPKGICTDGVCSYPPADGAKCDDGDACTSNDTCASGVCAGIPLTCVTPPPQACLSTTTLQAWSSPGTCSAGACSYAPIDVVCPGECSGAICTGVVTASSVSAGAYVTCALTPTGAVKCWGANSAGQLGNNTTADSLVPVGVAGLTSGVVSISTGDAFSCALTATGTVKCWGFNGHGQLGNNTTTESHVPVGVVGLSSGALAVSAGGEHACAVTSTGAVVCWGNNASGQLGNNSTTESHVPVPVTGLSSGVVAVSASPTHTCALTVTGGLKCWGSNVFGQLGNNTTTDSLSPVDVVGLSSGVVRVIAADFGTCALTVTGGVKCWGNNYSGQLGDGSNKYSNVPVDVVGLASGVLGISAGRSGGCAITSVGAVKCWGSNIFGQLGNNTTIDSTVPVDVAGLASGVVAIESGDLVTCAILSTGGINCWGWNATGQLGNNSTIDSHVPVSVVGF